MHSSSFSAVQSHFQRAVLDLTIYNCSSPWMPPEEGSKAGERLEGLSCEQWLRNPGYLVWRKGHWGRERRWSHCCTASWGGEAEREVLNISPCNSVMRHVGTVQSCVRGDLDCTLEIIFLPRGCSNILEEASWRGSSWPRPVKYFRGIWTVSLQLILTWSALDW